ncbi:uncharacterized protein LOC135484253 [Lineus longissimus]|uniref:uncharacterized protein LOC135484253 n=1 Tax=Lineus longissimus TaxID=88925 RepID=UPI00315D472F
MEPEFDATGRRASMVKSFDQHFVGYVADVPKSGQPDSDVKDIASSNQEYIHFLRERDELKQALQQKVMEYGNAQGKNFELVKKVDLLETEIKQLKSAKGFKLLNAPANEVSTSRTSLRAGSPSRGSPKTKRKGARTVKKSGKSTGSNANCTESTGFLRHPVIPGKEALSEVTYEYYTEISASFPDLRISLLLSCERKFVAADKDNNGSIDVDELDAILTNSKMMFTKKQVQDIIKSLDTDDTGSLDFMEVLTVVDRLSKNKNAKLPSALEQNKSAICVVQ